MRSYNPGVADCPWQMGEKKKVNMMPETAQAWHSRINYMIRWMPGLRSDIQKKKKIGKIKACIGFRWYLLLDGFTSSPSTVILYWIIGLYLAVCHWSLSVHLSVSELEACQGSRRLWVQRETWANGHQPQEQTAGGHWGRRQSPATKYFLININAKININGGCPAHHF